MSALNALGLRCSHFEEGAAVWNPSDDDYTAYATATNPAPAALATALVQAALACLERERETTDA